MIEKLRALGLDVDLIMMLGGVDPKNPADEDGVVAQLLPSVKAAMKHGISTVSSTSIDVWMGPEGTGLSGEAFDAAVDEVADASRRLLDAMEREKAFLFASQEGRFLWHIDEALRRLYKTPEIYGRCHSCKGEIAFERLDALPHARYCIDCKQKEEDAKK